MDNHEFSFSKSYYKTSLFYAYPIEDYSWYELVRPYCFNIFKTSLGELALKITHTETFDQREEKELF